MLQQWRSVALASYVMSAVLCGALPCLGASDRPKQRFAEAKALQPPSSTSSANDSVWVAKSDESKSCGTKKPVGLAAAESELQKSDVRVLKRKKLHDGKMRIQVCGTDKGDMNGFLISRKDLDAAAGLGFKPVLDMAE